MNDIFWFIVLLLITHDESEIKQKSHEKNRNKRIEALKKNNKSSFQKYLKRSEK